MLSEIIIPVLIAVLSSTAISSVIIFFVNRKDTRQNELALILKKLEKLEKDSIRTQLLLLISNNPTNTSEILTLAEYYFDKLKGDWYMSAMFEQWLEERDIALPLWFKN